ncbi:putative Methyl-accepting chemotaxis protein [Vibrio nigripulchritudo SFn27]|uniref:Putative Methyl-accepting chemotaxis protein n=1 Tax=Vibrio nigripulchritudo TaxID=28173 RepID=U4K3F3_9VIBR|nr:methyl-accepting chemotaxis protein [Vibrio nigripulchritudo]CCN83831.1 putative Methyl-accepting chemotaxis protein [Vibrio nigripulchritudo BLFn1]CCN87161.1 putative Methyl-accepting chemotaxis protein [Vibrio nigripulchritudo SFn27]CCN94517.1 putative Methyl-accepting chemotaxis protein [Vibrio nigripulchritudo ENn2]CCO40917.1 putative Methyl-accepting chemotaxis protein [Vibrio nigripulchritudo SFn135]CCO54996.1 putative Methyl-accepting chemotaxis protein [Vibrio nigripulchritudo Wn13]
MSFKNLKMSSKLLIGFSIPIVAIVLLAIVANSSLRSLLSTNNVLYHNMELMTEAREIHKAMIKMESVIQGFLISGKVKSLERYHDGQITFDNKMSDVKIAYQDEPELLSMANEVEVLQQLWVKEVATPLIAMRHEVTKGEDATKNFFELSKRNIGPETIREFRSRMEEIGKLLEERFDRKGFEIANLVMMAVINQETGQRGFMLSGDTKALEPYQQGKENFERHSSDLKEHLANIYYDATDVLEKLNEVEALAREWREQAAEPEIEARHAMNKVTTTIADIITFIEEGTGEQRLLAIEQVISQLVAGEIANINLQRAKATESADSATMTGIVVALMALFLVSVITIWIVREVRRQVGGEPHKIASHTRKVADGDLSVNPENSRYQDSIYASLVTMTAQLRSTLSQVSGATKSQSNAAEALAEIADQTNRNVQTQIQAVDQVSVAIEEMQITASTVANSAASAAESAGKADQKVKLGSKKANDAACGVTILADSLNDTSNKIQALATSANQISNILNVIKSIADQTNLLALNAAIEAARAGDQGRGFAVVADEVRSLAKNTQDSTVEIEEMISKVQLEAQSSVESMKSGQQQASVIVELTNEVNGALTDIEEMVSNITDLTNQIASATEQQSIASKEVGKRSTEIRAHSVQTGEGAQEIAVATGELKKLSIQLEQEVSFFRL